MSVQIRARQCSSARVIHFNLASALRRLGRGLVVTGILALTACGDSSTNSTPDPQACASYSISGGSVGLFERVTLVGVTSSEEIDEIRIEGPQSDFQSFLGQADDSSFFFTAPLHPDLEGAEGSLRVWLDLAQAAESCDLGMIDVSALPPSDPNEADEVLSLLEQAARSMLQRYAFDTDTFDPLSSENSIMDLSLARLHRALFDEKSPTRISIMRSDLGALPASDRSFIGAVLKETHVRETLEALIELYDDGDAATGRVSRSSKKVFAQFDSSANAPQRREPSGDCYPANVTPAAIHTAEELSQAMIEAKEIVKVTENWRSTRDLSSALLNVLGLFGGPAVSVMSLVGSGVVLYLDTSEGHTARVLPSKIEDVRMHVSVNPINEDYMDESSSLPEWYAYATASSQGADLKKDLFKSVLWIAGAVPASTAGSVALINYGYATDYAFASIPDDFECFSIPAHTWSNIDVTGREWLDEDPTLSGDTASINLEDPNKIEPVDVGVANIEIVLSREKFPCEYCPDGSQSDTTRSDDIDVTVREKEVVFSRSAFLIPDPSGFVTVTGAIQNSSRPELFAFDFDNSGVSLVRVAQEGANFSLTFKGNGDPKLFPVEVSVKSESTKLPDPSENLWFETRIVLEKAVEIDQDGDGCVGENEEVNLTATVIGLNQQDVSWEVPPEAALTPVSPTEAVFSASEPGTYSITAVSTEDPDAEGTIELVVQACDFDLYVNSLARVSTEKSDSNPNCSPGSHLEPFSEEEQHGLPWGDTWVDTGTFRNAQNWTEGGSFTFDLSASENIFSTYKIADQCHESVVQAESEMVGTLSSRDNGQVVDIGFDLVGRQSCAAVAGGVEDCKSGIASLTSMMHFVLEHKGRGTQSYDYAVELFCTADMGGTPVQIITSMVFMDSAGQVQNNLMQSALDNESLGAISRVSFLSCTDGQPISVGETFNFQDYRPPSGASPAESEPYTAMVWVSFSANSSWDPAIATRSEMTYNNAIDGTISLRPAAAP